MYWEDTLDYLPYRDYPFYYFSDRANFRQVTASVDSNQYTFDNNTIESTFLTDVQWWAPVGDIEKAKFPAHEIEKLRDQSGMLNNYFVVTKPSQLTDGSSYKFSMSSGSPNRFSHYYNKLVRRRSIDFNLSYQDGILSGQVRSIPS